MTVVYLLPQSKYTKEQAMEALEQAIREAEARALTTPCPSPCECGHWLHQHWCPTGRANLDRFTGIGHG